MNKTIKTLLLTFSLFFIFICSIYVFTYFHESTHSEICRYYGANDTISVINILGDSYTTCTPTIEYSKARELSAMTDIVGYHILALIIILFLIILFLFMCYRI